MTDHVFDDEIDSDGQPWIVPWEWRGAATVDDMMKSLESLSPVFGLRPADYAEFVLPMTNNVEIKDRQPSGRTIGTGKYESVTKLYFQVAGRQAMLRDCVDRYGWEVDENEMLVTEDKFSLVRMEISIRGTWNVVIVRQTDAGLFIAEPDPPIDRPVSGSRWGIGKLKGGDSAWEKAETTARGRALGAWGFGLLPGSGLASVEEMSDTEERGNGRTRSEEQPQMSPEDLRVALLTRMEHLRQIKDSNSGPTRVTVEQARDGMLEYVQKQLGVTLEVTEDQIDFSRLTAGQLQLLVNKYDGWIRESRKAAEIQP